MLECVDYCFLLWVYFLIVVNNDIKIRYVRENNMAIAWSMHLLHTTGQLREESGEFVLLLLFLASLVPFL
jgi:hypothetical protein